MGLACSMFEQAFRDEPSLILAESELIGHDQLNDRHPDVLLSGHDPKLTPTQRFQTGIPWYEGWV